MNLGDLIHTILVLPLFELLKFLTLTTGNFGFAILLFTVVVRTLLVPLTIPGMKSQKKLQVLKPELDKLKALHKNDPKKMQAAQIELYQKHNINVFSGCLPQIVQIVILISLYNVLSTFVETATKQGYVIKTMFFGMNLSQPDPSHILPIVAAVAQLVLSLMLLPGGEKHTIIPSESGSKKKELEKQSGAEGDMAEAMQKQMIFMLPLMTALFAWSFPAALGLYWVATTIFSIGQQWVVTGPGGLLTAVERVKNVINKRSF